MASTSTYLNFPRETEAAFAFYKSVFGTEFEEPVMRFGNIPASPDMPGPSEEDRNLIMHIALPILGGHVLHGTDAPESMGFSKIAGDNMYIVLNADSKEQADKLFDALSAGGNAEMPMSDQFWGDYFGSLVDKFGIHWMVNARTEGE